MTRPTIVVVGDWNESIFAEAVAWLQSHAECACFDSPAAALRTSTKNSSPWPLAVVVLQSRPSQFAADQIERLHTQWPLAHLIALVGPWCEGEMRSGRPLPGVHRVPWKSWHERLAIDLGLDGATSLPTPRTITVMERIESAATRLAQRSRPTSTATVCTANQATWEYLADALNQLGCAVSASQSADQSLAPVDAILFDGWENLPLEERRLERADMRPKRILLLHFPRPTDLARARSLGIDAVINHTVALDELAVALNLSPIKPHYGNTRPTPN